VKLLRRSRLFKTIVVPLPPSWLLRAISRWASRGKGQLSQRGAGFKLLYLDDDMRMHLTFDGQYFVQRRPGAVEGKQGRADSPWTRQALARMREARERSELGTLETEAGAGRAASKKVNAQVQRKSWTRARRGQGDTGAPPPGFEWGGMY